MERRFSPQIIGAVSSLGLHLAILVAVFTWKIQAHGGAGLGAGGGIDSFPVSYSRGNETPGAFQHSESVPADVGQTQQTDSLESTAPTENSVVTPLTPQLVATQPVPPKPHRRLVSESKSSVSSTTTPASASGVASPGNPDLKNGTAEGAGDGSGNGRAGLGAGDLNARARPLAGPKPPYPPMAQRLGFEGSVVLTVSIGSNGRVLNASIKRSSGRSDCDQSALQTLLEKWVFQPALVQGSAVDSVEEIVVIYSLNDL